MKVIGQSTLADGSPYLHLGYISASPAHLVKKADPTFLIAGATALLVGLGLSFSVSSGKTKSGFTTIHLLRRASLFGAGMVLAAAGCMGILMSIVYGKQHDMRAEETTRFVARQIVKEMAARQRKGEPVPENIAQAKTMLKLEVADGWFREMRLTRKTEADKDMIVVLSAGHDGKFGTNDDLRFSFDLRAPVEDWDSEAVPPTTQPTQ